MRLSQPIALWILFTSLTAIPVMAAPPSSRQDQLAVASKLYTQGNLQACYDICSQILKKDPHDEEALCQRAAVSFWWQKYPAAIEDSNACKATNAHAVILRAKSYSAMGEYKKSLAELEHLFKILPKELRLLSALCLAHLQTGQTAQAVADAIRLTNFVPHSDEAMGLQSLAYAFMGDSTEAAKSLGQYFFCKRFIVVNLREQAVPPEIKEKTVGWNPHTNFLWMSEYRALTKIASQSIASQPRDAKRYVTRALLNFYVRNYTPAVKDLEKAISLSPDLWSAHILRAVCLLGLHQYTQALSDAHKAIEIMPNERASYDILDVVYYEMNGRDKMTAELDKLAKKYPANLAIALISSSINVQMDEREKAITILSAALKSKPQSVAALIARGEIYVNLSQIEKALADFDQALTIAPNNGQALLDRGTLYLAKGDANKALVDLNKAVQLEHDLKRAWLARAICYDKLGKTEAARTDRADSRGAVLNRF